VQAVENARRLAAVVAEVAPEVEVVRPPQPTGQRGLFDDVG
jgi:hypothetical protein